MPKPKLGPNHRTNPLIWCAAIICAILAVVVIIAGIVVFISYLTIKPRVPQISVTQSQLDTIYFDQSSLLTVQVTVVVKAENDNTRTNAGFYDIKYHLSFRGRDIAILMAPPFDVRVNRSLELSFVSQAISIPLSTEEAEVVGQALRRQVVDFELKGTTRTRWRVWPIGSINLDLHLNCQLHLPVDKTPVYPRGCSSRSK